MPKGVEGYELSSRSGKDRDSNLFGEWIQSLNTIFGVGQVQISNLAGIDPAWVSRSSRGGAIPTRRTVLMLWDAYYKLAQEHHLEGLFNSALREGFLNSGDVVSEDQMAASQRTLEFLDVFQQHIEQTERLKEEYRKEKQADLAKMADLEAEIRHLQYLLSPREPIEGDWLPKIENDD